MKESGVLEPLKEVATIAAGNAATALATLIGHEVTVAVPTVRLVGIEKVLSEVGDVAKVLSVVVVKMQGDMQGTLVFSLQPHDAKRVVNDAIKQQVTGPFIDQDQTVLLEMISIVAGAALNSIGTFLNVRLTQSLPVSSTDMLGAVLDPFIAEFGTQFDKVLVQQEEFVIPASDINLKFLVIIDPPSTNLMLQKITKKITSYAANN